VYPVELLSAAEGDPEPGDHFVEDEQHVVLAGGPPQELVPARQGRDDAAVGGHGFGDHGRKLVSVLADQPLGRLRVVVAADDDQVLHRPRDAALDAHGAGTLLGACEVERGAGRDGRHARPAVVHALELEDLVPARIGAREADGGHRGFAAGVAEAHQIAPRHRLADLAADLVVELVRERAATLCRKAVPSRPRRSRVALRSPAPSRRP